jgi:hypothetical protein
VTNFNLEKIEDKMDRENAVKLAEAFKDNPFLNGSLKHYGLTVTKANPAYDFKHNLGFTPKDIWLTWVSDGSNVVVNYALIDDVNINFNFPGPCTIRFFAGLVR